MPKRILLRLVLSAVLFTCVNAAFGQPAWTFNLLDSTKRASKFEERKLGSEKMADKKFTKVRHVFQNNYTHFNYYYNAHNKINAVLEKARAAQKDDYTKLLNYYPYSLDATAAQKRDLDSVIYKATAGILLHDLRNDWIDNMYLLMGQAYFFKKDFDSAAATFQFINYNLFPRKKDEDDSRVVGTGSASSSGYLSIANKEKQNILQKLTAKPPSRNDALIWMILTLIEQNELSDAASLINTLQHDDNLPKRLVDDLAEVNAYWFFKQNIYDSAATHLEQALSNAPTKQDLARSEFLLAQLFENGRKFDKAAYYYSKASVHTTDPMMDIYAELNSAKMLRGNDSAELNKGINNLLHMAKKDKFELYRDIIYYSAGDLSMQLPDSNRAVFYYKKSLHYNETNSPFKNKAFLQLADIAFNRKDYKVAYAMYDSIKSGDTSLRSRFDEINDRKNALAKIVQKINIIEREDSLQKVAAMPVDERTAFVKKLAKQYRKQSGQNEDGSDNGSMPITFDNNKNQGADLFSSGSATDWYFDNASTVAKGSGDFKRKWGTRTNADDWARKSATGVTKNDAGGAAPDMGGGDMDAPSTKDSAVLAKDKAAGKTGADSKIVQPLDYSYEGLMANLPLTPEKLAESNTLVSLNLFELAKLYQSSLEDYPQAIVGYNESLRRFPDSLYNGGIYFGLYYCYMKLGNAEKAAYYKKLVNTKFAASPSSKLLDAPTATEAAKKNTAGTKRYEAIYTLFIEGRFDEALAEKKNADSLYGNNYWTPQLLYIEAVYHVKQHEDSSAIAILNNIVKLYPKAPLKPKAARMIDVLKRRKEIEKYLTALQVTRMKEDSVIEAPRQKLVRNDSNLIVSPKQFYDSSKTVAALKKPLAKDSAKTAQPPALTGGPFTFDTNAAQNVVMVLDKVDGTYINESKNAFTRFVAENFRDQSITVTKTAVAKDTSLLVFASFTSTDAALQFLYKIRKAAPDEVSWLPAAKYYFLIISDANLALLLNNKHLKEYKELLTKQFPGKF